MFALDASLVEGLLSLADLEFAALDLGRCFFAVAITSVFPCKSLKGVAEVSSGVAISLKVSADCKIAFLSFDGELISSDSVTHLFYESEKP